MPQTLSEEVIYGALADDGRFAELPGQLASTFGARSTLIHWVYSNGSADVLGHSRYFTDEQLALYAEQFVPLDPWLAASADGRFANRATDLEQLVPVPVFTRTAFYNDYVRAIGDDTCRCLGMRIGNAWGSGFIALQRGLGQGSFGPADVAALDGIGLHLRRMLTVRGRLAAAGAKTRDLTELLDRLGQAVWLVTAAGKVLHMNAAAEEMLANGSGLSIGCGLLRAASPADRQLEEAIARVGKGGDGEVGAVSIATPAGARIELSLIAIPAGAKRRVLVTANVLQPRTCAAEARLRALYGLSLGEAQLAAMLAEGASVAEMAEQRRVSEGTVRVQIKNIAAKMGCSRQTDIVRRVKSLPPLRA